MKNEVAIFIFQFFLKKENWCRNFHFSIKKNEMSYFYLKKNESAGTKRGSLQAGFTNRMIGLNAELHIITTFT